MELAGVMALLQQWHAADEQQHTSWVAAVDATDAARVKGTDAMPPMMWRTSTESKLIMLARFASSGWRERTADRRREVRAC